MTLLFCNFSEESPDDQPGNSPPPVIRQPRKRRWVVILGEQLLNSAIVGGIAGLATLAAGQANLEVAAIAFGITALSELRKYRKL